jgi:hypothetical protein
MRIDMTPAFSAVQGTKLTLESDSQETATRRSHNNRRQPCAF